MAEDNPQDIQAQLDGLRDLFTERLETVLPELERHAQELLHQNDQGEALNALNQALHKLAGSAGAFGFDSLGNASKTLELQVRAWLEQGRVPAEQAQTLLADVRMLRQSAQPSESAARQKEHGTRGVPAVNNADGALICLVEDDETLTKELIRVFGHFGYRVDGHARLTDAASAIARNMPDALIMDVVFHDNGLNTIEHVALHPVFQEVERPIIFLSDQDDFQARVQAARIGAQGFFLKPLDIPKLVDRLEQVLRRENIPPYRLLVVDDDENLARRYELVLRGAGMEVKAISNPEQVLDVMAEFHPELILMDLAMPEYTGADLARVIRMHDEWLSLPIVYLSAETDMDKQLSAMSSGGDDFLTKPISDRHLVAAVSVRAARMRQLSELMTKDSLTGLLKHSRIKEEIAMEFARAKRNGKPLCVAMLDIDHFKVVNDTHGHAMGDQVIKALAHLLKQRLRKTDSIGRYGGEEFAVALPDCDPDSAFALLEDIRARFKDIRFIADGAEFSVTLSAGAALADDYDDPGAVIVAADEALYAAKHGGRDQIRLGRRPEDESGSAEK